MKINYSPCQACHLTQSQLRSSSYNSRSSASSLWYNPEYHPSHLDSMLPTASLVHQWYHLCISEASTNQLHYPYLTSMVQPPKEQLSMEPTLGLQAWLPMPWQEQHSTTHFCFSQDELENWVPNHYHSVTEELHLICWGLRVFWLDSVRSANLVDCLAFDLQLSSWHLLYCCCSGNLDAIVSHFQCQLYQTLLCFGSKVLLRRSHHLGHVSPSQL